MEMEGAVERDEEREKLELGRSGGPGAAAKKEPARTSPWYIQDCSVVKLESGLLRGEGQGPGGTKSYTERHAVVSASLAVLTSLSCSLPLDL